MEELGFQGDSEVGPGRLGGSRLTSQHESTVYELIEILERRSPEYLDLFTAETDEECEAAFDALLEKAIGHLERNKTNYEPLDEVGLSGVLVAALTMPGLSVTQETHSNGHVDLTIEA